MHRSKPECGCYFNVDKVFAEHSIEELPFLLYFILLYNLLSFVDIFSIFIMSEFLAEFHSAIFNIEVDDR